MHRSESENRFVRIDEVQEIFKSAIASLSRQDKAKLHTISVKKGMRSREHRLTPSKRGVKIYRKIT